MKICPRCNQKLKLDDFHKNQTICKVCRKKDDRDRYENKGKKEKLRQLALTNCEIVRTVKKNGKCKFCPENNPVCLDFHHRNPEEKKFEISKMMKQNTKRLLVEIQKCDLVCANCHRKIHAGKYAY